MGRGEDPHRVEVDLHHLAQVRRLAYGARGPPEARRELGVQPFLCLGGGGGGGGCGGTFNLFSFRKIQNFLVSHLSIPRRRWRLRWWWRVWGWVRRLRRLNIYAKS